MGRLTATLAHEIKNPLAIIRGSAERLRPARRPRRSAWPTSWSRRRTGCRARWRATSSSRAARDARPATTGDARAALDATLDLLEGELRGAARDARAPRQRPASGAGARSTTSRSKQVYLNLILNALEAMPEGGRSSVARPRARDGSRSTIADDGPGIPAEMLRRLGDPFFTTKAQGSRARAVPDAPAACSPRAASSTIRSEHGRARHRPARRDPARRGARGAERARAGGGRRGAERRAHRARAARRRARGRVRERRRRGAASGSRRRAFDAVVTDLRMAPPDGLALLAEVRRALARHDAWC